MKNKSFILEAIIISVLLSTCGPETGMGDRGTTELLPTVLWKSGEQSASPDAVDSVRIQITYGDVTVNKRYAYSANSAAIQALPTGETVDLLFEGVDAGGTVVYRGEVLGIKLIGESVDITITANQVSPLAPSGLTATPTSPTNVRLDWTDNSSNETGFIVFRGGVVIDTVLANRTSYTDDGLVASTQYRYSLTAYNNAGAALTQAQSGNVTTLAVGANSIPAFSDLVRAQLRADTLLYYGMRYARAVEAADPDTGDVLVITASSQFAGLQDSITWTPADTGIYNAWVKVTDGKASDSIGWRIHVKDTTTSTTTTNSAPRFSSSVRAILLSDTILHLGTRYAREIVATDNNTGDSLRYSASSQFSGLSDSLIWEPINTGTFEAWVKVTDGMASDSIGWRVRVVDTATVKRGLDSGLVAWYPFDGNANDESGNGNNGTRNGATLTTDRFGTEGKAYSFIGTNDNIEVSTSSGTFNSQTYTIAFWIKNADSTVIVAPYVTPEKAYISRTNTSGNLYGNFVIFEGGGQAALNYMSTNGTMKGGGGQRIMGNTWKHLAFTVASDSIRSYLNGQLLHGEPFIAGINFNNTYPIRFGKASNPYWGDYGGALDDIRFYNRALSAAEIDSLYREGGLDWKNTVVDIDGNVYKTVTIGNQTWMAENLKTTKYNDGSAIPLVTAGTWGTLTTPAYCWYNNNSANQTTAFGALYNSYTVQTGKLAPTGWHVPTDIEWSELSSFLGGHLVAGGKLKESGTAHWASPNAGATNSTGFTALPVGFRGIDGIFSNSSYADYWWSSTACSTSSWVYNTDYSKANLDRVCSNSNANGFSVRCIKD